MSLNSSLDIAESRINVRCFATRFSHSPVQHNQGEHMPIQTTEIEQDIRSYLTEEFLFGRGEALTDDAPLLGNIVDSQGVIELIVFVQQRFKIEVADEEVTTDNFASVKSVVAFIEKKLRRQG
jgi:acyl carrier protein